jgi:hypothetical protein
MASAQNATQSTSALRKAFRILIVGTMAVSLSGCDFGQWILQVLDALGMAPRHEVRMAGGDFFTLDKKDGGDGTSVGDGYMCVVHNPGCHWFASSGNDGTDKFFQRQILPAGAEIVGVDFERIKPYGLPETHAGGVNGSGSYGATLLSGPRDGSVPIAIQWNNTCQDPNYGSKNVAYRISFRVSVINGIESELPDSTPDLTKAPPACASELTAPPPSPTGGCKSGELTPITVGLEHTNAGSEVHYVGTTANPYPSSCTYRLESFSVTQQDPYLISFLKTGQSSCADAPVRLGPALTQGARIDSTEADQIAIFGEAHPKHPITFVACVGAGTSFPNGITISVTLKTQ